MQTPQVSTDFGNDILKPFFLIRLFIHLQIFVIPAHSFLSINDSNKSIHCFPIWAIVYFSATGNTEQVAQYIQEATNGTLIEIVPQEEYTDNDLNYGNEDSRTSREQNSNDARPAIANDIDVSSYDVIYLGYPIWWGDVPKIILTFLDEVDLSGKTVIPFCTSGGSGIESSMETLKNYNSSVHWIDGKRLSISKRDVVDWVNQLDY